MEFTFANATFGKFSRDLFSQIVFLKSCYGINLPELPQIFLLNRSGFKCFNPFTRFYVGTF